MSEVMVTITLRSSCAFVWLKNPFLLSRALGLTGQFLCGQAVVVTENRAMSSLGPSPQPHAPSAALHNQGAQEGKGKGWVKGAYLGGAAPAQSTWQKDGKPGRDREQGKEHNQERQNLPKEVEATASAAPENSEPPETTAVYCPDCQTWLNGPRQWEDHKIGKKHRKNVQKQRAGGGSSTKASGTASKKNEPILALPSEHEELQGKSETADWLCSATNELVKSQVRDDEKAGDGEAPEEQKRSRRSRRRKKVLDAAADLDPEAQGNDDDAAADLDPEAQGNDDDGDDDPEKPEKPEKASLAAENLPAESLLAESLPAEGLPAEAPVELRVTEEAPAVEAH